MANNYSQNDYIFLGKQVAEGKYVRYSTFMLSLVLVLLLGIAAGRYLLPQGGFSLPTAGDDASGQASSTGGGISGSKADLILRHEESVRANPNDPEAWVHLGNLYYDSGQPKQAINAYEKALAIRPDDVHVLVDCGVMFRELKEYDKALEYFNKALKVNPMFEPALFNSGVVLYHDLKRREEGLAAWRKLVQINPKAKTPRGGLVSDFIKEHESGEL